MLPVGGCSAPLQASVSGLQLAPAPTVAGRPLGPQCIEDIVCARLWANFLPSRNKHAIRWAKVNREKCPESIREDWVGASNPERLPEGSDA